MKSRPARFALPLAMIVLSACAAAESDDAVPTESPTAESAAAVSCSDVSGTTSAGSMAITDPAVLAKFSFARTMDTIRKTADVGTQSDLSIFQTWMKTFGTVAEGGTCNSASVDPNKYGITCPREPERKLATINPFVAPLTFTPVAVFNRFDLTPGKGQNCGEHRIIYAMTGGSLSGRAFIIFEAALPNPHPELGVDACLPVAQFWQGLTAVTNPATRAAKLEKFYYTGGAVAGFEPVVKASHYGLATNTGAPTAGQVRTNFFIDFAQWHLREFKTHRECTDVADSTTCKLSFKQVTVKNNPANELFAGTHAKSAAFRTAFAAQVPRLAAGTAATIGMSTSDSFNEFESISEPFTPFGDVEYGHFADAAMRTAIQTKLTSIMSTLSVDNILTRATTQTCGGCHRLSAGDPLGGKAGAWPADGGFVQVNESGGLSPALTGTFIPHRIAVLENFINTRCGPPAAAASAAAARADDSLTIGGSAVDAPN